MLNDLERELLAIAKEDARDHPMPDRLFISIRLLTRKLNQNGRVFSREMIIEAVNNLEAEGFVKVFRPPLNPDPDVIHITQILK